MTTNPTPSDGATQAVTAVTAAQAALAGEHACVYGYGIVGAQLPDDASEPARQALAEHRSQRDGLAALITDMGADPVAALPAYVPESPVTDQASATALAVSMEQRLSALYADLVAAADSEQLRGVAAQGLIAAALAQVRWGGSVEAFPGLDDRLD